MKYSIIPKTNHIAVQCNPLIYINFYGKNFWHSAKNCASYTSLGNENTNSNKGEWYGKPDHSRPGRRDLCCGSHSEPHNLGSGLANPNKEVMKARKALCGLFFFLEVAHV